jgi:hypothetical protein
MSSKWFPDADLDGTRTAITDSPVCSNGKLLHKTCSSPYERCNS